MDSKDQRNDRSDTDRTGERPKPAHRDDRVKDMRKANENIRKSQGDDSAIGRTGNRPAFDRDR